MGRETVAVCHWRGEVAEVKLHLDSMHLQLFGDLRADIPRAQITDVRTVEDGVSLKAGNDSLTIELAPLAAKRWHDAIIKQPPTLAQKLGIGAENLAIVLGQTDDITLNKALHGASTKDSSAAALIIAVIVDDCDLTAVHAAALAQSEKHVWMIYPKGKGDGPRGMDIRKYMRERDFIDSKSCAVSDRLTATRYRMRADG